MNPVASLRPIPMPMPMPEVGAPEWAGKIPAAELQQLDGAGAAKDTGTSFARMLDTLVDDVNTKQLDAGESLRGVLTEQNVPLHQAMIAMQEAGVAFRLMVEVRNKMLEAYNELMRMQV